MTSQLTYTRIAAALLALLFVAATTPDARAASIDLTLSGATNTGGNFGGSGGPGAAISDTFNYDPDADYENLASLPNGGSQPLGDVPNTFWAAPLFMTSGSGGGVWTVDVAVGAGQQLDFIDIWGRTNAAVNEESRTNNLTITFYDAAAGGGSVLGTINGFNTGTSPDGSSGVHGTFYNRAAVSGALTLAERAQVQSFSIGHTTDYLLLAEVRAGGSAIPTPAPEPSAFILAALGLVGLGLRRRRTRRA